MCKSNNDLPDNIEPSVTVKVDVSKIVKYVCITGLIVVGIIFGTKTFHNMLDKGFFDEK